MINKIKTIIKDNCNSYECIVIPIAATNPLENIETLISQLIELYLATVHMRLDVTVHTGVVLHWCQQIE